MKRGHNAINCDNRLNISKFLPSHGQTLSSQGPNGSNRGAVNTATNSSTSTPMTMWYPDTGETSHITVALENIQYPHTFNSNNNNYIYTVDDSPFLISQFGKSIFKTDNRSFILKDMLLVTRNLLFVNKFCIDNNVSLRFDSQRVQV